MGLFDGIFGSGGSTNRGYSSSSNLSGLNLRGQDSANLDRGVAGFGQAAQQANQGFAQQLGNFNQGVLGSRENALIANTAARTQAMNAARAQANAASGMRGSQANILNKQAGLLGSLGLNQARFQAGQNQAANLQASGQGLQGLLAGQQAALAPQFDLARLNAQQFNRGTANSVDKIGGKGLMGAIGGLFG